MWLCPWSITNYHVFSYFSIIQYKIINSTYFTNYNSLGTPFFFFSDLGHHVAVSGPPNKFSTLLGRIPGKKCHVAERDQLLCANQIEVVLWLSFDEYIHSPPPLTTRKQPCISYSHRFASLSLSLSLSTILAGKIEGENARTKSPLRLLERTTSSSNPANQFQGKFLFFDFEKAFSKDTMQCLVEIILI